MYLASLLIQLAVKPEKQEKTEGVMIPMANKVAGVTMRALTVKNRFIPSFLKTELYLNFQTGLDPYAGLLEIAEAFEVIESWGFKYKTVAFVWSKRYT